MTTWENIFTSGTGADLYTNVFFYHQNLYIESTQQGSVFNLYEQMIRMLPFDVNMVIAIFSSSIFYIAVYVAILFVLFMPFMRKPQKW